MGAVRILDVFCGGGGASMGYYQAGCEVVGVDISPQPNYPFEFIQADAIQFLHFGGLRMGFDAIHASPPCQRWSRRTANPDRFPDYLLELRFLMRNHPYVIENVEAAPLLDPVTLCGSSFGLGVRRHRLFETNWPLTGLPCDHASQGKVVGVYGQTHYAGELADRRAAMGIDWMENRELVEAIPPAYTEYIGRQLIPFLHGHSPGDVPAGTRGDRTA